MLAQILILFLFYVNFCLAQDSADPALREKSFTNSLSVTEPADLYGEVSTDNRTKDVIHYSKLTARFRQRIFHLTPYLGAAFSGDSLSDEQLTYNDNYAAPFVGFEWHRDGFPIRAFTEFRESFPYNSSKLASSPQNDWRLGATGGAELPIVPLDEKSRILNENYGEAVFSSRLENNIFVNFSDQLAIEHSWNRFSQSRLFLQGYARRDLLGYYYENLQELRWGLRQKLSFSNFSLALSAHLAQGSYTSRQYRDPNPNPGSYTEAAFLMVFGGQL